MPVFLFFIIALFSLQTVFAQTGSIRKPLDIPLYLSGTFGELRTNHFHSGLDIKTNGKEGLPVYAVDDGYVYRIKITRNGYGKALYIKHPSGLVSVYGHLQNFNDQIEAFIKQKQYEKQQYEIELFPYAIELPVQKGEVIAYSGNSGGSSGPHLHFELRNILEHPLNPMAYGIRVKDTQRPVVKKAFAYPLDNLSEINKNNKRVKLNLTELNDSVYLANKILASGSIGFGVESYDRQDKVLNHNGLYKITVSVNGLQIYAHEMMEFSFANSKFINAVIDYPYYLKFHRRIQKLWVESYNKLEIYTQLVGNGSLNLEPGKDYLVEIELSDFDGNKVWIKIPVQGRKYTKIPHVKPHKTPYYVEVNKKKQFFLSPWSLTFYPQTSFENFYLNAQADTTVLHLMNPLKPLQKSYLIKYPLSLIKPNLRPYAYIALYANKQKTYYINSVQKNDNIEAHTKKFGNFIIRYDSIAPYIKPVNFKDNADLTDYHFLRFKTGDKQSGIKSYNGYIDDEWILLEYDYKKASLIYNFDDKKLTGRQHKLLIIVEDRQGNIGQYKCVFYRKE